MKSPILILFIIFNLLAVNLVLASNMYDEEKSESHLVQSHDDTASENCIDESSCDHFCHASAHMLGFISHNIQLATVDVSQIFTILDDQFYSLTFDPLLRPPQA